jgi:hypothetical protein
MNPRSYIMAAGDFNVIDIQWESLTVKEDSGKILYIISENQLYQLQREPTQKDAVLDLFFISNPSLVKSLQTIPGISDHDGIILTDI